MTGELLDMKEDNSLVVKFTPVDNDIKKNFKEKAKETGKKIRDGLNKETAGTGMSINQLSGGAKIMATISNIGGGSKETGGGGVVEGLKTIVEHVDAKGKLEGMVISDKLKKTETLSTSDNILLDKEDK